MGNQEKANLIRRMIYGAATKWREERVHDLEVAFAMGSNVTDACVYAKISRAVYYVWIDKYPTILDRIERVKIDPILRAQQTLMTGLTTDPRLAFDYLQKKRSEDYAPTKSKVEVSGSVASGDTNPKMADAIAAAVTDELRRRNIEANKDDAK